MQEMAQSTQEISAGLSGGRHGLRQGFRDSRPGKTSNGTGGNWKDLADRSDCRRNVFNCFYDEMCASVPPGKR
jgi:hypothetical protein